MPRLNLRKLIHKKSIDHSYDGEETHGTPHPVHKLHALEDITAFRDEGPRGLYLLYSAIQRRHGKWLAVDTKDKRMRTCFKKLSQKLDELHALGLEVDEVEYICAHKATYGDLLRPNHLISWCSLGIYQSYLTDKRAGRVEISKEEQDAFDAEMVDYLMQLRGESREEVTALLEGCDLL